MDLLNFFKVKDFKELQEYIDNNPNDENVKIIKELMNIIEKENQEKKTT